MAGRRRDDWGEAERLPSGRWRARFTGPDGKRHKAPSTFRTKGEARTWLARQRTAIVDGDWTPATVTVKHELQAARAETLGDYGARWIEERISPRGLPLRESTKAGYRSTLRNLDTLLPMPLTSIKPVDVERWYRGYVKAGKITSASHGHSLTRAIMATAVDEGLIETNPCKVKGASSARTGRSVEPPTDAELAIITAAVPERYRALVALAAWSALRYGEQTELRRGDIDDDGVQIVIRVRRGVTYVAGQGFIVGPPKTERSKRDVVLPPSASAVLRDHFAKFVGPDDDALLFPAVGGAHLHSGVHKKWWIPAREAAGRPDLPWHGLRHYGMTQYAKAGATMADLMARAGHTSIRTVMRYQHATGRDAELARRMDDR